MGSQPFIPTKLPSRGDSTGSRGIYWLALSFIVWRFVCLAWLPLNLSGLPGALFEASAFAGTSLVVTWLVLSDHVDWRRVLQAGAILVSLRVATFAGFLTHIAFTTKSMGPNDSLIFRFVEDQTLIGTLTICLLLRSLTRLRLTTLAARELASLPPRHVTLGQLFVLTGLVAGGLGARQAAPLIWGDGFDGAIHLFITAHVVAIVVTTLSGLLLLLGSVNRWTWIALITLWLLLLPAINGYFLGIDSLLRWENWVHFSTAVAGPVVTTLLAVAVCRAGGLRLRVMPPRARREFSSGVTAEPVLSPSGPS